MFVSGSKQIPGLKIQSRYLKRDKGKQEENDYSKRLLSFSFATVLSVRSSLNNIGARRRSRGIFAFLVVHLTVDLL